MCTVGYSVTDGFVARHSRVCDRERCLADWQAETYQRQNLKLRAQIKESEQ